MNSKDQPDVKDVFILNVLRHFDYFLTAADFKLKTLDYSTIRDDPWMVYYEKASNIRTGISFKMYPYNIQGKPRLSIVFSRPKSTILGYLGIDYTGYNTSSRKEVSLEDIVVRMKHENYFSPAISHGSVEVILKKSKDFIEQHLAFLIKEEKWVNGLI